MYKTCDNGFFDDPRQRSRRKWKNSGPDALQRDHGRSRICPSQWNCGAIPPSRRSLIPAANSPMPNSERSSAPRSSGRGPVAFSIGCFPITAMASSSAAAGFAGGGGHDGGPALFFRHIKRLEPRRGANRIGHLPAFVLQHVGDHHFGAFAHEHARPTERGQARSRPLHKRGGAYPPITSLSFFASSSR